MTISPIRFGAFHPIAKLNEGQTTYEAGKVPDHLPQDESMQRIVDGYIAGAAEELTRVLNGEHPYERDREGVSERFADGRETLEYGPGATEIRDQFRTNDPDYALDQTAMVMHKDGQVGVATGKTALIPKALKKMQDALPFHGDDFAMRFLRFMSTELDRMTEDAKPGKALSVTMESPHSHASYVTKVEMADAPQTE